MNFLSLTSFWWLLAIIPIVLLYLLRARREPLRVSSLMLWQRVEKELEGDPALKKLQRSLLLLLQILVIILLCSALAEPVVEGTVLQAGRVTIILDASASMKAIDELPNRFQAAKEKTRLLIEGLPKGTEARLLVATNRVTTACGLTREKSVLLSALEKCKAYDCAADLREATEFALAIDGAGTNHPVFLVTDGAGLGEEPLSDDGRLTIILVGTDCSNTAITELTVRRSLIEGSRCQAFARIANYSQETIQVGLTMKGRSLVVDNRSVTLKAGEEKSILFSNLLFPDGDFSLVLSHSDGKVDPLPQDDQVDIYLAPLSDISVFVSKDMAPFFGRAFGVLPNVRLVDDIKQAHIIVSKKEVKESQAFCHLCVNPEGDVLDFIFRGKVSNPRVGLWKRNNPLLRGLSLQNLFFTEASQFLVAPWARAIVEDSRGRPMIAAGFRQGQYVCILAFAPTKSDWPLTADFPLFLTNLTAYVRSEIEPPSRLEGGQVLAIPKGVTQGEKIELLAPEGKIIQCAMYGGILRSEPLLRAGTYKLKLGTKERPLCVTFPSRQESDLRRVPINTKGKVAGPTERHQGRLNITWLFVLLATFLALLEYAVWSRGRAVR